MSNSNLKKFKLKNKNLNLKNLILKGTAKFIQKIAIEKIRV